MPNAHIVIVALTGCLILGLLVEFVRRQLVREKYSLLWFFLCAAFFSVPIFYNLYSKIGISIGIKYSTSLFFFVAIIWILLICFQFTLAISTAYNDRKTLNQHIALLENRVSLLEKELKYNNE